MKILFKNVLRGGGIAFWPDIENVAKWAQEDKEFKATVAWYNRFLNRKKHGNVTENKNCYKILTINSRVCYWYEAKIHISYWKYG